MLSCIRFGYILIWLWQERKRTTWLVLTQREWWAVVPFVWLPKSRKQPLWRDCMFSLHSLGVQWVESNEMSYRLHRILKNRREKWIISRTQLCSCPRRYMWIRNCRFTCKYSLKMYIAFRDALLLWNSLANLLDIKQWSHPLWEMLVWVL